MNKGMCIKGSLGKGISVLVLAGGFLFVAPPSLHYDCVGISYLRLGLLGLRFIFLLAVEIRLGLFCSQWK